MIYVFSPHSIYHQFGVVAGALFDRSILFLARLPFKRSPAKFCD
jgi:hypothetical protein